MSTLSTFVVLSTVLLSWRPAVEGLSCYLCAYCTDPYQPLRRTWWERQAEFFDTADDFLTCTGADLCIKIIPKEDEDLGIYLHRYPMSRGCRYETTHTGCREEYDSENGFPIDVCVCDTDYCNHGDQVSKPMTTLLVVLLSLLWFL